MGSLTTAPLNGLKSLKIAYFGSFWIKLRGNPHPVRLVLGQATAKRAAEWIFNLWVSR